MQKHHHDLPLLTHAVDQILNRIRLLAREMCPEDRERLEAVVERAFRDLSEIAAVETKSVDQEVH